MAVFSIIAATAWWGAVTATIGTTLAAAAIAVGQAVTWSLASAALMRPKQSRAQVQASITQPEQPRVRGYGRNLFGGCRVFWETYDGVLRQVVVMQHTPVDGLIRFWFNNNPVDLNSEGFIVNNRFVQFYFRDGTGSGGGDYPVLREVHPDLWSPAHRLVQQATFYVGFGNPSDKQLSEFFPDGPSTAVQAEVRASKVPPIGWVGESTWTENAGRCIRDYLTHADGWAIPNAKLDGESFDSFSRMCNQPVALKNGGTEFRYRLAGYYTLEDPLEEVTMRMLATCDGQVYETAEGKLAILGGQWSDPDVTIEGADIFEIEMEDGYDPFTDYNVLQGSFVSPENAYQPTEVQEIRDETALAMMGERKDMLDVDMCPSPTQLMRLMKIKMAKDRREHVGVIRTNLVGLKARFPKGDGIHTIRIRAEEFGLDDVFEVTSHTYDVTSGRCEIGIASLKNPYAWNAATEETPLPKTRAELMGAPFVQPPPVMEALVQEPVTISNGVTAVKLSLFVVDPGQDGLEVEAQIARGNIANVTETSLAPWVEMPSTQIRAESGILDDGETYTVRMRWAGRTGWVKAGTRTVVSNPDTPEPPTDFSGMAVGSGAYLEWVNAPTRYSRTQILMATTNNAANAAVIATVTGVAGRSDNYTHSMAGQTGTRYFWARTLNPSGVPSVVTESVTLTFSAGA